MRTITSTRAACLALTLCWSCMAIAQVAVPPLTGHVTDQTGTLSADQRAGLEQTLQAFEAEKGSQLAVLIVPSVAPASIEQYALRIEVGYGLEGALNDATSKRIVSEISTPRFKQGDFYGGIAAGVDQMIRVVDGEPLPEPTGSPSGATVDNSHG